MTPKQRALNAFSYQKTDQVPLCVFLGGSWPLINNGVSLESLIGNPKRTADIFWQTNQELHADIVMSGSGATALQIKALGGDVRFNDNGAPEIIGEPIKEPTDLDSFSVQAVYQEPDVRWLIDTCAETVNLAGEDALVLASGRAPFTLAGQIYGMDRLFRAMLKNSAYAKQLLEFTTKLSINYYDEMIRNGKAHGAFIADPTSSGDCISKKHFEEFALPYLIRVIDSVKKHGKPVMLHICGNITDRLPLIADSGADCISIDSKVDLKTAKILAAKRISIAGNVNPVQVLEFGTVDDVNIASLHCLLDGAKNGGYILTPGCDFGAGVPKKNLLALSQCINKFKGDFNVN